MIIVKRPADATNLIDYEVSSKSIDFDDGELVINLKKKVIDQDGTLLETDDTEFMFDRFIETL